MRRDRRRPDPRFHDDPPTRARMTGRRLLLLLALLLALPAAPAAQVGVTTDLLSGRVTDPDGRPVAGALVEAVSGESGVRRTARTGQDGRYTIAFPDGGGRYRLRVTAAAYAPMVASIAREVDEDVLQTNFRLATGTVALEGLEVTAQRAPPPGRGDTGAQERNVSGDLANRLPLENTDAATLASLSPGVVTTGSADSTEARGSFSVAGQRTSQNQVTLDGASFSSGLTGGQAGGGSPLGIPQEGVRGTQVVTSTFDVSRGQFSGGLVAMTTRSGTNAFAGSFQWQLRDPSLQWSGGSGAESQGFRQNRVSGGVGGPILRDRLFYYVSFQLQRRTDDLTALSPSLAAADATGVAPDSVSRFLALLQDRYGVSALGETGDYTRTGDALSTLARVDWTLSDTHTLALRGHLNLSLQDNARIGRLDLRQNGGESDSEGAGGILTLTSRFGSGWINELRASLTDDRRDQDPYAAVPEGRVRVSSVLADGTRGVGTLVFGGDRSLPTTSHERSMELNDELSLLWRETHRIKVGALLNHTTFRQRATVNRLGTYTFNSLEDFEAGQAASFTRSLAPRESRGGGINAAAWLGDTWRPRAGLQFTYGARIEHSRFDDAPARNARVEELFGRRTDALPTDLRVSPRVGFSWRISEQGAPLRVLRGGVGEFRGRAPFGLYAGALEQTGLAGGEGQLTCVGAAVPQPDWEAFRDDPSSVPSECAGGLPGEPVTGRPNVTLFDDGFGAPRSWRATIGLQAQLRQRLSATVDAGYTRGLGLYGVRDLNLDATPAFTLASEGGRPVYASPAAIVPETGEVSFASSRRFDELAHVFALDSELASDTKQLTVGLNGSLARGFFFNASYTHQRATDQSSFSCCAALQGFASPTTAGDPNRREWATSDVERRHQVVATVGWTISPAAEVTLVTRASSGSPFTPLVGGDVNGDGVRNDRAFVFDPATVPDPAVAEGMQRLLASSGGRVAECLRASLGRVAERNACRGPWSASVDLRATLKPKLPSLGQRVSLSIDAVNLPAGLDRVLHGSDGLRGWGGGGFGGGDPTLLYVRGFDPATQRFRYEVNERFGTRRGARAGGQSAFQLQLAARVAVGAQPQQGGFGGGLAAIAFGGGGGGFGGPGGRGGGGGFDPSSIIERLLPQPVGAILLLRDTLKLTPEQVTALQAIADTLDARNAPVADSLREALVAAAPAEPAAAAPGGGGRRQGGGAPGGPGGNPAFGQIFQRFQGPVEEARANVAEAMRQVQGVLTQEQWRRVPAALRNPLGAFGGNGGGRRPRQNPPQATPAASATPPATPAPQPTTPDPTTPPPPSAPTTPPPGPPSGSPSVR
jgi:hypothetical protein